MCGCVDATVAIRPAATRVSSRVPTDRVLPTHEVRRHESRDSILEDLKERLKADFDQEEILIVQRDVETL